MQPFSDPRPPTHESKTTGPASAGPSPIARRLWCRFAPLALLGVGLVGFLALGGGGWLDPAALARHREELIGFTRDTGALVSASIYMAVYAAAVAISVPGATVLTLAGGFMFGTLLGSVYAIVGATLGACAVFLAARSAIGEALRRRAGPGAARLAEGFRRDAFHYMLFLRLVPVFPFWLVNLAPAALGVPFATYALATLIGIVPGAVVYASLGAGTGALVAAGDGLDHAALMTWDVVLPMVGLGALSLLPLAVRRPKRRGGGE